MTTTITPLVGPDLTLNNDGSLSRSSNTTFDGGNAVSTDPGTGAVVYDLTDVLGVPTDQSGNPTQPVSDPSLPPPPTGTLTDIFGAITNLLSGAVSVAQAVKGTQPIAIISSNVTPDIPLYAPASGQGAGGLLAFIRPSVTILGGSAIAPAGTPTPGLGVIVFAATIGLAAYGLVRLIRR